VTVPGATTVDTGTALVIAEILNGVGIVTLNRPERRNALHPDMFEAVPRVLRGFADDADVGCVMLTGAGPAFCAGGDVRDGGRLSRVGKDPLDDQQAAALLVADEEIVRVLHGMPKVTIAALAGPAVGAGLAIALAADLRIAAPSATMVPGWGQLGLSGDFGGAWFLTRLVGPSRALQILTDGAPIDAPTALRLGLVNRIAEDGDMLAAALSWAQNLAAGPTVAWAAMKSNISDAQRFSLADALPLESRRMVACTRTEQHRRAVREWRTSSSAK
jgi:2-(1,2-epoxy-1,2-dihydrophenyl)acetyl-CoA isomerase